MRKVVFISLIIVPFVLTALNKVNIEYNRGKMGQWHKNINEPIEQALTKYTPLTWDYFERIRWHEAASTKYTYSLSNFFWVAMLRLMPISFIVALLVIPSTVYQLFLGDRLALFARLAFLINLIIVCWFFFEFLLCYNLTSSMSKIIAGVLMYIVAIFISVHHDT